MTTELTKLPSISLDGKEFPVYRDSNGAEVMRDLDIAAALGLADLHKIRSLIKKHMPELGEVSAHQAETPATGGRPAISYYLTEEQALYIAAKCRTKAATAQLKRLIAVYMEARKGNGGAAVAMAQGVPAPALRFEVGNGDALEVAQYLITAMKTDRQRVDQIADRQTTQETALASNVTKTEQLGAKVDALSAKRSRSLDGVVHVSAVKVAAELGIQPLAFNRFVKARNIMRLLQRKDGKWPLDLTVAKYRELIADPNHPVYAEVERVVPTIQRAGVSKYLRAWAATQRTMNADQYADAMNLCYDEFARRAGYDPRVLATGRLSPLDIVQVRGHIDLLLQVMHEVCPMTDAAQAGMVRS